mgnify:CR=1 FL=1
MSEEVSAAYIVNNVEALYPKLDRTYNWSASYKASLKGSYNGQKTQRPTQYDAKVKELPEEFQLTTGSLINIAVVGVPYSGSMGAGVSLRLKSVQVLKLAEKQNVSPFEATDGFTFGDDTPFSVVEESPKVEEDPFEDEEIEEPKKVAKKTAAPKKEAEEIADVLEDWDD